MGTFFVNNFSGGMNEIISPALLPENTAALLVNCNLDAGNVQSVKLPHKIKENASPEYFNHFGSPNRSTVKFYERNYWSNNNAYNPPFYGGDVENYLGIPYPDYEKNVTIEAVSPGEDEETTPLTGDYKYCVTFVNPNGWESAPGAVLDYERKISLDKQFVKITVSWDDDRIAYAKIYRTSEKGADFYCVGEIHESSGDFIDKTDDYALVAFEPLQTIDNYPPPDKGRYLCEAGGVFFLAVNSTLWFSSLGNPHAWPKLNFIGFDDIITGIVPEFQGVLVFTRNNAYRITGADDITTLTKSLLPGNQGCVNNNTIAQISNAPVWLSNDGICLWDGESITVISRQIINTTRLPVVCAASGNDCYFLFLTNGAIVYNHRSGDVFSKLDFTCSYAWYDSGDDCFYLQRDSDIYLYDAGAVANYTYISPHIGVPEAAHTYFTDVIAVFAGTARILFFCEDKLVFDIHISSGGRHHLRVPYNTLGKYCQVKIVGCGTLKELAVAYK